MQNSVTGFGGRAPHLTQPFILSNADLAGHVRGHARVRRIGSTNWRLVRGQHRLVRSVLYGRGKGG